MNHPRAAELGIKSNTLDRTSQSLKTGWRASKPLPPLWTSWPGLCLPLWFLITWLTIDTPLKKEKKIKEHIEPQEELSMEMARAATAATGLAKLN